MGDERNEGDALLCDDGLRGLDDGDKSWVEMGEGEGNARVGLRGSSGDSWFRLLRAMDAVDGELWWSLANKNE